MNVTAFYGKRVHPITGETASHEGIDIGADEGAEIAAAHSGEVIETGFDTELGNYVMIESGEMTTLYAHCSEINVKMGENVQKGQIIAYVGSTGQAAGSFLHFEVRIAGETVNLLEMIG